MILITTQTPDGWDEIKEEFVEGKTYDLYFEHSLATIAKWEAIWHIPYHGRVLEPDEAVSYLECMLVKGDPEGLAYLTVNDIEKLKEYIEDDHSAAVVIDIQQEGQGRAKTSGVTVENIYGWMFDLRIPLEWEHRHFNRLIRLIRVMQKTREPDKKKTASERAREMQALNKARRAKYNTKG